MKILISSGLILLLFMTFLWVASVIKKDASIVDRVWGLLFVLLATSYYVLSDLNYWRQILVLCLVSIWGIRLSLHIHLRNKHAGEDVRYKRMREKAGKGFWWKSFFTIFLLQGILAFLISAPLYVVQVMASSSEFSWFDGVGVMLWLLGFYFEAVGDWQLTKFKANPDNKGKLLTTGLWALTRHPNYFGDACLWWGYFILALNSSYGLLTVFSPMLMTLLIRYVSGVTLLEKDLGTTKPGYESYVKNTPPFFPKFW